MPVRRVASPASAVPGRSGGTGGGGFNHGFGSGQVMPQISAVTYGPGVTGNGPYKGAQFAATNVSLGHGGIFKDVAASAT